jgi:hypothetical protein
MDGPLPRQGPVLVSVVVDVVLRKLGRKGGRVVAGRLIRPPRSGSVVVIEFPDGLHEYVTTPVKRVLRLVGDEVFFLQTANSCYRLEIRSGNNVLADSAVK